MGDAILQAPYESQRILGMILAGGEGKRLAPLTSERAKPAVPFGGRYRIIDIVLSNFVNSGLHRIKILTQYKSASLEEHIARSWRLSPMLDNFIETIPAQQRTGKSWFKGSADAVYQTSHVITDDAPDHVFIFGGDHVYKMDLRQMFERTPGVRRRRDRRGHPLPSRRGQGVRRDRGDEHGRIVAFHEKVDDPPPMPGRPDMSLASMGNYIFRTAPLLEALETDALLEKSAHDFGRDIIPCHGEQRKTRHRLRLSHQNRVPGEEVGQRTTGATSGPSTRTGQAQMDLVAIKPAFNLYNQRWPLRTGIQPRPAGEVRVPRRGPRGSASPRRAWCPSAASSRAVASIAACCPPRARELVRRHRRERAVRERGHRAPRQDPPRHHRQGRGDPRRHAQIGYDLEDRKKLVVSDDGIVVIPKRAKVG
jgi:glucose-1-phosphate adenylyltransferase